MAEAGGGQHWIHPTPRGDTVRTLLPALCISMNRDSTTSLGTLCSVTCSAKKKKKFPYIQKEAAVFQFVPVASVLSLGIAWLQLLYILPSSMWLPKSFWPCPVTSNTKPKWAPFTDQQVTHQNKTKPYQEKPEADFHHSARFWHDFFFFTLHVFGSI